MKSLRSRARDLFNRALGRVRSPTCTPLTPPAGASPVVAGGAPFIHPYGEGDIVNDDLTINVVKLASIAAHRACLEYDRAAAAGVKIRPFVEYYDEQREYLRKIADVLVECRTLRRELVKQPPEVRAKALRDLQEYKRKYGLGGHG